MSNVQPQELSTVLRVDPLISFHQPQFVVEKSASTNQTFNVTTSNYSGAQTSFLINVNSRDAIINGYLLMEQAIRLRCVSSRAVDRDVSPSLYQSNLAAFKNFPINRLINTITCRFGNVSVSSQVGDLMNGLSSCFTKAETRDLDYGLSISLPDKYKYVIDGYGAANNPLNTYVAGGLDTTNTRGAWPQTVTVPVDDTGLTEFTVDTVLYEPLWISPLVQSLRERVGGFTHLTSIEVIIQWKADGNNIYSFSNQSLRGADWTATITPTFTAPPILYVNQLVDPLFVPPAITNYNYSEISNRYTTDFTAPAPVLGGFSTVSVSSQTLQLDRIPKKVMIWASRNQNNLRPYENSYMMPIQNVSINFNNVNYCSEMAPPVIYANSVRNGLNMQWIDWSGLAQANNLAAAPTAGGPLVFDFGACIPLPNQYSVGCSAKVNFSATVQFANKDGADKYVNQSRAYTMYIAFQSDSSISLFGNNVGSTTISPLSEIDVLKAQSEAPQIHASEHGDSFGGASGLGFLNNYISSGKLKKHAGMVRMAAPLVKYGLKASGNKTARHVADAMNALGFGEDEMESMGGTRTGGELVGGRGMSKAQLKRRLLS